ncbi:MAG TPA: 3-oxoacyl-[acyl-carrier-protein] synthase III C-terminal domain-containing protein [Polyangiaceae bacterium]|nr:3-oxoacyl-[acyl-carrier-protein] synthase III C-terminal domain-containing protein [Polyangiaceae bacterium]
MAGWLMGHAPCKFARGAEMLMLTNFSPRRPAREIAQVRALEWLAELHAASEASSCALSDGERAEFAARFSKLMQRVACGPEQIGKRGHVSADLGATSELELYDVSRYPRGQGSAARSRLFSEVVDAYFEQEFAAEKQAPSELVHVTCTGYVAPSGAQRLVAKKNWGERTHVTHAYHMGCYAAFPAIRIGAGQLGVPARLRATAAEPRVDIVHTELCTLHLDPSDHSAEQCVVQSLFADGFIRYSLCDKSQGHGLELLALSEQILPDSAASMGWSVGDFGMHMTLSRDVPERIAGALRPFVSQLFDKADLDWGATLRSTVVAVHPGGPKIIDRVREVLELSPAQVQASRDVLFECGNMSSATLPHVWHRILADESVRPGTVILSLAFGPGLSVCGGLFRKH